MQNRVLIPCFRRGNMYSLGWLHFSNIVMSFVDIGRILGLLPFEGVMFKVSLVVSRSIHFSFRTSDILIPVSFSVCKSVAIFCWLA